MWATTPALFADFVALPPHGSQKAITLPSQMTEQLAFFLGAFAAEGHIARSNHTVRIANMDERVIARLVADACDLFGFTRVWRAIPASAHPSTCPRSASSSSSITLAPEDARRQAHPGRSPAFAPRPGARLP